RDRPPARHERRAPRRLAPARAAAARRAVRPRHALRRGRSGPGSALREMNVEEEYILLGLRLGKHVDGLVDAYYGPPELAAQVDAEPLTEPAELVGHGDRLLAGLDDGWLRDQALGLRTYAGVLAGEELSYSDEVERSYGVRPRQVDTAVYEEAHARLDELLPPGGDLAERYEGWRQANLVPPDRVVPVMRELLGELRELTAQLVDLPNAETLELDGVHDEPWWAFNYYQGGLRSRVVVNLDVPTITDDLVELSAHEVYPGHHTEHALKEQLLGERIQLVPTPDALISEGIAETGPALAIGDAAARIEAVLRGHGLEYDFAAMRAVREARRPLRRIGLDAALMIYEEGASREEAEAHVRRWALSTPEQAAHSVRFVLDPTWRAYVINYSAGRELVHRWVGGDPQRFARLLTERVRVADLV